MEFNNNNYGVFDQDFIDSFSKIGKFFKKFGILLVFVIVIFAILNISWDLYMQYIQLQELGGNYQSIFLINLKYKILTVAFTGVSSFIVVYLTSFFSQRGINSVLNQQGIVNISKPKNKVNILLSLIISFFTMLFTGNAFYEKIMMFFNSQKVGVTIPVTNLDVGYYLFQRPFLISVANYFIGLFIFALVYTVLYYIFSLTFQHNIFNIKILKNSAFISHAGTIFGLILLAVAYVYNFSYNGIVYGEFYNVIGAGYVASNITKYLYLISPYILFVTVILSVFLLYKKKYKFAIASIAVLPVIAIVFSITAGAFQQFVVKPNEPDYENQYLKNNMQMTKEGFGLNNIKVKTLDSVPTLTKKDLEQNQPTVNNIRTVDYKAALRTNVQLESNTYFYTFVNGDIIPFSVNGKEEPVFITAREISTDKLPGSNSYINKTFKYTHGYGIVINPINQLSSKGQIKSLVSGLRMETKGIDNLKITQPRIYYGENTNNQVVVNPASSNKEKEIDMDGTTTTSYSGQGGIKLNFLNKLLFAIENGDANLFLSDSVDSNSKILLNRQIIDRARMALPFLNIDSDPYIVVSNDGKLEWVIDAYTTSDKYPYVETYEGVNYIRNSVKVTIDAYNGKVTAYVIDKTDPIINLYQKLYPNVFSNEKLPEYVTSHMRYPETLFKIQTEVLKKYHLDQNKPEDVNRFYENQDRWEVGKFAGGTDSSNEVEIEPYYNMICLPGKEYPTEEMILMRPFTPSSASSKRNNMVAWCAVRNNASDYGEIVLYKYPRNTNIFGPEQVEVNINQISEVSQDMTLWGQNGSEVYKGNLLSIPFNNSVLYVEPIYIQAASESSVPQVVKVVAGYQNGNDFIYSYKDTLQEAINTLFDGVVAPNNTNTGGTTSNSPSTNELPTQVPATAKPSTGSTSSVAEIKKKVSDLQKQLDELNKLLDNLK